MSRAPGCLLALLLAGAEALAPGVTGLPQWHPVDTLLGTLKVREFGPHDGPLVICIHGMMDSEYVRDEWNPAAERLAQGGFHVLVPDFHSGPEALRPGTMSGESARAVVGELAQHLDGFIPARYRPAAGAPKLAVLGKSWGAEMAAEVGALPQVVAVALVVPVLTEEEAGRVLPQITGEVALLMVRDDATAPIERGPAYRKLLRGRDTWVEAESGGHRIVEEFVEPLAAFLQRAQDRFRHGADDLGPEL